MKSIKKNIKIKLFDYGIENNYICIISNLVSGLYILVEDQDFLMGCPVEDQDIYVKSRIRSAYGHHRYLNDIGHISRAERFIGIPQKNVSIEKKFIISRIPFIYDDLDSIHHHIKKSDFITQYTGQFPVTNVSFINSLEICNLLSLEDGLDPVYTFSKDKSRIYLENNLDLFEEFHINPESNGYRLPKEYEWECACKASQNKAYPNNSLRYFGDGRYDNISPDLDTYMWYYHNSNLKIHSAAQKNQMPGVYMI